MQIKVFPTRAQAAEQSALQAAGLIANAVEARGEANVVAATGVSQFELLEKLTGVSTIDWSRVTFFHLDEYVGLPETHPGSFRRYLKERIADRVPLRRFYYINGSVENPQAECRRLSDLIRNATIDVLLSGIGQNGHLAFNEPPADFETQDPFLVIRLTPASREQQLGEGWFESLKQVPEYAISMSISQITKAKHVICIAPGSRKAEIVRDCLELEISPWRPASILRNHASATIYLDSEAASLLRQSSLSD